jgi:flagellar biosynthetic protein FliP
VNRTPRSFLRLRTLLIAAVACLALLVAPAVASAATAEEGSVNSYIMLALYLGGLSLLPFAVMTLTSFLRIVVVLSFLRSGLGAQNVPPNIVIIALALFLSLFVMGPTVDSIKENAIDPMKAGKISGEQAIEVATGELKHFMVKQISGSKSSEEVKTFYRLAQKQAEQRGDKPGGMCPEGNAPDQTDGCLANEAQLEKAKTWELLPLRVIAPAFLVSELKKAFIMGFAVLLPFLVIDMVISNILLSLGMFMLPPQIISLPFKILLFVVAGGWSMVVKFLITGFNY